MKPLALALVVEPDATGATELRAALEREPGIRILTARSVEGGLVAVRAERTDLVLVGAGLPSSEAMERCRSLRCEAPASDAVVIRVSAAHLAAEREEALRRGFDGFVGQPLDASEVVAVVRGVVRLRRMRDQITGLQAELDHLNESLRNSADQALALLVSVLDAALPGASERGRRIADMAGRLAARFGVPDRLLRDLDVAARMHELGRLAALQTTGSAAPHRDSEPWAYGVATASILLQMDGLRGAAEVVGGMHENWDGTGLPDHRLQGQTPLRSRILRVVSDFLWAVEGSPDRDVEEVLPEFAEHAGTRYDPMVVVHLQGLVRKGTESGVRTPFAIVPVHMLNVGMVLAEDLYTGSGIKLLSRDATITSAALETILRRHELEPILHGAVVYRSAA